MKFALIPKEVKAQMTSHDERLEQGKLYPVIYTREATYPNGKTDVVVALAEYDKAVREYPIRWFSIEDYQVATSEQE